MNSAILDRQSASKLCISAIFVVLCAISQGACGPSGQSRHASPETLQPDSKGSEADIFSLLPHSITQHWTATSIVPDAGPNSSPPDLAPSSVISRL